MPGDPRWPELVWPMGWEPSGDFDGAPLGAGHDPHYSPAERGAAPLEGGGITATKATAKRAAIYPGSQRWMNGPATSATPPMRNVSNGPCYLDARVPVGKRRPYLIGGVLLDKVATGDCDLGLVGPGAAELALGAGQDGAGFCVHE